MRSRPLEAFPSAKRATSLRALLIYPFVILIVAAVALTGFLSLHNSENAIEHMAWRLMDETTARIEDRVSRFLNRAHLVNEINSNAIESGQIDLNDARELELHFWSQVRAFDYISYSYIGLANGGFYGARRLVDGTLQTISTETPTGGAIRFFNTDNRGRPTTMSSSLPSYDHKTRPWYKAAVEAGKPTWSPVFVDAGGEGLTITAATPLYDAPGTLTGVLGCSFIFSHINQYLQGLKIGESGLTFIVDRSGMLVATSTLDPTYMADKKRIASVESDNPKISRTGKAIRERFGDLGDIHWQQRLFIHMEGERYFVRLSPLSDRRGIDWLIVVAMPENDFMSDIKAGNLNSMVLSLLALGMTVALGLAIARRITRPILELNIAARSLADGDWSKELKVDRRDEVGELARSFNLMVQNLKATTVSRDRLAEEIEERKRAEEARRESEEKFSIAFHHAPAMAAISVLEDGTYLDVNNRFLEVLGLEREQVLGKTSVEVGWLKAHDRNRLIEILNRDGKVSGVEVTSYAGNGSAIECLYYCSLVTIGGVRRLLTMLLDVTDRKRAEGALKESEERFRAAFELATVGMAQGEPSTGRLERVNSRLCEISGYSAAELIGRSFFEITHPEDREEERKCLQALVRGDVPAYHMEKRYVRKDGAIVWVNVNATVLRDVNGKPSFGMAVIEDITERKLAEESLRESEERHRVLFEGSPVGILAADIETKRFILANPSICNMFGYTEAEFLRLGIEDVHPKADLNSVVPEFESLARGRKALLFAVPCLRKDGTVFYADVAGTLTTIRGGEYVIGFFTDVTERKQSEAERTLLATAVEQAEENILVTDERRMILYVNPAFERSSGYRLEDLQGKKLGVLRSARHDEAFYRNMKEALDRGEVWIGSIINKGRDGTDFEIEGSISPLKDPSSGAITHFVAAGRNMSRFRKLERELYQAQKMESVGRLAGGVAHDFNNMLGVILGHAELALLGIDPADAAYVSLQEIEKAAHRSAKLISQLLAFARKQTISPEVLDINTTVESMLKMVRRLIGEDIELLWKPDMNVWPVKVDPTQIDQILANLCVNARDAIDGVGKVIIQTSNVSLDETYCHEHAEALPGDYVLLAVSDNGCGMEKDVLDRLFEPFFTTKGIGKGTGLGLATVYGIVKQNNGFIEVQSDPDRGTTFRIYLPRTDASLPSEQSLQEQEKNLGGTETILLVEDDESLLELSKKTLEHYGYAVLAAGHPMEALAIVEDFPGPIDLLITDVIMPGMNGRELAERLRAFKSGFRSIFMSGYTSDVIAQHGVLNEGVHFLQKPFSVRSLTEKVRKVLEG